MMGVNVRQTVLAKVFIETKLINHYLCLMETVPTAMLSFLQDIFLMISEGGTLRFYIGTFD